MTPRTAAIDSATSGPAATQELGAARPATTSATLPASAHVAVALAIDAGDLPEGAHQFDLTLTSDDPANPTLAVPVVLEVGDTPTAAPDMPRDVALLGAVPNPFNPQTQVRFELPSAQHALLQVFDVQGRLVRVLVDGVRPAGRNQARWDGRDRQGRAVASGTYFARLRSGDAQQVRSMVLVR